MATGELPNMHDGAFGCSNRAVVLLSGGIDSSVAMALALKEEKGVYPLAVDYGQLHGEELNCAYSLCDEYRDRGASVARLTIVEMSFGSTGIKGSSLTDAKVRPTDNGTREDAAADVYVPGRNTFLLALAASYAEQVGASEVYVGFTVRGFPDCRPGFVKAYNELLRKGLRRRVQIVAPLIRKTKVAVVRLGLKLGVPLHHTRSCLRGGKAPCGKCNSCYLRAKAFRTLGVRDPAPAI